WIGKQLYGAGVAVGLVEADTQVETSRLLVQGKEIRIVHRVRALEWTEKHAAGAMLFGESHLVNRIRHAQQGGDTHPAQLPLPTLADARDPAVVCAAKSNIHRRAVGIGVQKEAGIEHLNLDAELVDMLQASLDVLQLPRLPVRGHVPPERGG